MWAASTLIVAPTSTSARDNDYHPEAVVRDQRTRLMIDQIQAVDRSRLGESVGYLTFDELSHVNEALRLVLDL
jgi:mRNA interferase MazF